MSTVDKSGGLIERAAAGLMSDGLPSLDRLSGGAERIPQGGDARDGARPGDAPVTLVPNSQMEGRAVREFDGSESGGAVAAGADQVVSAAALERAGMISIRERREGVGEDFRVVRQQIFDRMDSPGRPDTRPDQLLRNVVLVTSAQRAEGKSFAALNLAWVLAEGGHRRVLLVDADVKAGSLTQALALQHLPGLLDLTVSPLQLARTYGAQTPVEGLRFLPVGGGADATDRMVVSSRQPIRPLIENLADEFDDNIVIIDSPACLQSSDPVELASIVGQIVMVVEAGRTRRRLVEAALDRLDPCTNVSLLLNRARSPSIPVFGMWS